MYFRPILASILLSCPCPTLATALFECQQEGGEIVYRQNGCLGDEETLDIRTAPPPREIKPAESRGSEEAISNTTVGGHAACPTREWYDDLVAFMVAEDRESVNAYFTAERCIVLKPGLKVTVTEYPGMFGGSTQIVIKGVKLWTFREAVNY
jgi:hypothetical protein